MSQQDSSQLIYFLVIACLVWYFFFRSPLEQFKNFSQADGRIYAYLSLWGIAFDPADKSKLIADAEKKYGTKRIQDAISDLKGFSKELNAKIGTKIML